MHRFVFILFFVFFFAEKLFSQEKNDTVAIIKAALEISDIKEPLIYVRNIRAMKETDRLIEKIKKGRFYVSKGDIIDTKDGKVYKSENIDSLVLSTKEIKYLVQKLEIPTIWQDSLFSNSVAFATTADEAIKEIDSINAMVSSKPKHYFYVFRKPVFLRNNTICFLSYAALCGGLCGSDASVFLKKINGKWIVWIYVSVGAF